MSSWQKWFSFGPAAAWYAFIFWLSSQPKLPGPENTLAQLLWFKTAHLIFYAILTCLLIWALRQTMHWRAATYRWLLLLAFWLVVFPAGLDELHQGLVPGRHMRWRDIVVDASAAAAVILVFSRYNRPGKP